MSKTRTIDTLLSSDQFIRDRIAERITLGMLPLAVADVKPLALRGIRMIAARGIFRGTTPTNDAVQLGKDAAALGGAAAMQQVFYVIHDEWALHVRARRLVSPADNPNACYPGEFNMAWDGLNGWRS